MADSDSPAILLTGATGFVGGALLGRLLERGPVRALVRDPGKLEDRPGLEAAEGDLSDPGTLPPALAGIDVAYYLVHSMEPGGGAGFADRDRAAAENFAAAAREAGTRRTVYLGGISSAEGGSEHLESRTEVEEILRDRGAPELVALRASMIVGAESASFLTLVQLVERLPILALPSWRDRRSQPVAIDDVIAALVAALEVEPGGYDVAGPDALTFERMTEIVGELSGNDKPSVPLPFSNSKLEGATAAAVVDADRELLEPLMAGLHGDLVTDSDALSAVFGVEPTPFAEAVRLALAARDGA